MDACCEIVGTRQFADESRLRAKMRGSPYMAEMWSLCPTLCGVLFGVDGLRNLLTSRDLRKLSLVNCLFRGAVALIRFWKDRSNSLVVHDLREESFLCLWTPRWIPLSTIEIRTVERGKWPYNASFPDNDIKFEALLVTLRQRASCVTTLIVPMFFSLFFWTKPTIYDFDVEKFRQVIHCFDRRAIRKLLLNTCDVFDTDSDFAPWFDIAERQERLRMCFAIFTETTTHLRAHFANLKELAVDKPDHVKLLFSITRGTGRALEAKDIGQTKTTRSSRSRLKKRGDRKR